MNGSKFIVTGIDCIGNQVCEEVYYKNDTLRYENLTLFNYTIKSISTLDFELIEDEIDIDSIEEFEIVGCNIKFNDTLLPTESIINDMILDKMNKLVQAVKQIDKRVKKLERK